MHSRSYEEMLFRCIVLLLLSVCYSHAGITPHVCSYIKSLLQQVRSLKGRFLLFGVEASTIINAGGHLGTIITPPHPQLGDAPYEDYFLQSVLIWDPYPSLFPSGSIQCCSCGGSTRFQYWNDGSSSSTQPQVLHDMHNIVLLVSAVYMCDNGHKLLAHDASVLKRFPTHRVIPFVLLGFTMNLVNTCTSLCTHGMIFYKIETFVAERRLDTFSKQHNMAHASSGEICDFQHLVLQVKISLDGACKVS